MKLGPSYSSARGRNAKQFALMSRVGMCSFENDIAFRCDKFPGYRDIRKRGTHGAAIDSHSLTPLRQPGNGNMDLAVGCDKFIHTIPVMLVLVLLHESIYYGYPALAKIVCKFAPVIGPARDYGFEMIIRYPDFPDFNARILSVQVILQCLLDAGVMPLGPFGVMQGLHHSRGLDEFFEYSGNQADKVGKFSAFPGIDHRISAGESTMLRRIRQCAKYLRRCCRYEYALS